PARAGIRSCAPARNEKEHVVFSIPNSFCLAEALILAWVKAAILDLKHRGHRFPNLQPGMISRLRLTSVSQGDVGRPGRPADPLAFETKDDLRIVAFYFDVP